MCGISAGRAGRFGYGKGVLVGMTAVQLGDAFFFRESAFSAFELDLSGGQFCSFFCDIAFSEGVCLRVQLDTAFFTADCPVVVVIIFHLR